MTSASSPSLLFNEDAINYLISHGDDDEASTSEYWREHKKWFNVGADGSVEGYSVLGNVSDKRSFVYSLMHRLLQIPLMRLAAQYRPLDACWKIGREVARRRRQQFTYDTLRHVFTLAMIRHYREDATTGGTSMVIGDGFGMMTSLLLECAVDNRAVAVNLTKSLALDMIYLRRAFPDAKMALVLDEDAMRAAIADPEIRVIAVQADNAGLAALAPIRLAVNIVSMQEMDLPVVEAYFDILRKNPAPSTLFYCCNRRFKTSNFEEYPWRDGDRILEEGICEWSQWYYTNRPPFYRKRAYGRKVVLHRLVELEKDHA